MSFKPIALATPKAISGASATLVSSSSAPSAPYPSDTRAKGWRFELDYERIEQSDTWALATPEMRPWLLMLWLTAWKQVPCGSLPASDELIAARIGMDARQFRAHRDILMRGWWLADDGRMYHGAMTALVLERAGRLSKRYGPRHVRAAREAERHAAKLLATPKWLNGSDRREIEAVYLEARRITKETGIPHDVDHIVPLRGKAVSGLHVPWNLRPIPAVKNRQKSNRFDGGEA